MTLYSRIVIICFLLLEFTACNPDSHIDQDLQTKSIDSEYRQKDTAALIPVNTFYSDYFPCNDCHSEIPTNVARRKLVEMHDDILYDHDSENRWCLACHSETNRDSLVLAGGKHLSFNESYKLCGQCHGPKYRDWRLGIHGKRTGSWNGQKEYRLCVDCHDPHSPRIKKLEPMPPPRRPEHIKIDSVYERPEENETHP